MELGALICTAATPACWRCPVRAGCRAYAAWRAADEQVFSAEPPPAASRRRVAERREAPFAGSSRFYRGRVVEVLRGLPAGAAMPLPELGRKIKDDFGDDDLPWLGALVAGLVRDGLLTLEAEAARLP